MLLNRTFDSHVDAVKAAASLSHSKGVANWSHGGDKGLTRVAL